MRDRMASTLFAATLAVLDTTLQKVHETLRERLADLRAHLSTQLEGALGDAHTSAVEFGVDLVAGFEQAHSEGVERMAVLLTEWIT